jgi:hypothetical protein
VARNKTKNSFGSFEVATIAGIIFNKKISSKIDF